MAQTLINSGFKASRRQAPISNLEQGFIRAFNTLQNWAERRRTRTHLYRLPDYMLRDIGVSRADVAEEYEKPFWKA
jgi:uncharacterized protein YjiS (DUF1127 family)